MYPPTINILFFLKNCETLQHRDIRKGSLQRKSGNFDYIQLDFLE